jgi:hypothetical protein
MNQLTSQQRKLLYLIGIIVLLVPITGLSLPTDGTKTPDGKPKHQGGWLSQLRSEYDLGESDLGDVDASGAAVNLVLLGMRGVAVNLLWIELDEQKDMKRWAEMQATTESIVRLQPHYEKVWDINGWNLAYNTSAEWDAVPDRYYWVKQGAKLLKRGVARNKKSTELYYRMGKVLQHKIGLADESVDYRHYFLHDPDPAFNGGPDPEINPDGLDNYLAAKEWFLQSCDRELNKPQHILDRTLFRSTPARCQFDYAQGLQKDGHFGEATREAWETARQDWTEKYGREVFHAVIGGNEESDIRMETTREEIEEMFKAPEDQMRMRRAVDAYQKMVNYRYWRTRAYAEAEHETAEAHRSFFEAKQAFKAQEFEKARAAAFSGMEAFDKLFKQQEYESLIDEETLCEECVLGWKIWDDIYQIAQEKVPEKFPLDWLVAAKAPNQTFMQQVNKQFKRLFLESSR